jgi:hypothetical protein
MTTTIHRPEQTDWQKQKEFERKMGRTISFIEGMILATVLWAIAIVILGAFRYL